MFRSSLDATVGAMSLLLAAVHLVSLVFGVAALVFRGSALREADSNRALRRVFFWDNVTGIVALFWVGSGLWRAFGGLEKGASYYLSNHVFWLKMLLLLAFVAVEITPMSRSCAGGRRSPKTSPSISTAKRGSCACIGWSSASCPSS